MSITQPTVKLNLPLNMAYHESTRRLPIVLSTKKIILFLLLFSGVSIILAACSAVATPVVSTPTPAALTAHYADPLGWFETRLPAGWDIKAFDVMQGKGVPPLLIARAQPDSGAHLPAFTLTSLLLPPEKDVTFLRQHWTWDKFGQKAKLADPLVRYEKTFLHDGRKSYRADLFLAGKTPQQWQVYMTTLGRRGYVLLFMDQEDLFSRDTPLFANMWNAFQPLPTQQPDTSPTKIAGKWMRKDGGTYRFERDGRYEAQLPGTKPAAGLFALYQNAIFFYPDGGGWDMQVLQRSSDNETFLLSGELFVRVKK